MNPPAEINFFVLAAGTKKFLNPIVFVFSSWVHHRHPSRSLVECVDCSKFSGSSDEWDFATLRVSTTVTAAVYATCPRAERKRKRERASSAHMVVSYIFRGSHIYTSSRARVREQSIYSAARCCVYQAQAAAAAGLEHPFAAGFIPPLYRHRIPTLESTEASEEAATYTKERSDVYKLNYFCARLCADASDKQQQQQHTDNFTYNTTNDDVTCAPFFFSVYCRAPICARALLNEPNAGLSDMASREKRNLVPSQKNKQRANDSLSAETNNTSETNNSSINTTPSTGRKAKQSLANNVRNQAAQEVSEVVGSQATSKVEAALPRKRAIQTALKKKQKAKKILIKPKVPIKTLKRIAEAKKILGKKKKGPAPKINQINIKTEPSENNINHTDLRNKSKTAKKATKNSAKANEEAKKLIKPPPKLLRNSRSSTASQKQEDLIVEEVKIKLEPIDYESTIESVVAASSMIIDDTIVKVEEEETEVEVKKLVKNPFSGKKNLRNGKLRSSSNKAELDAEKKAIMSDEDQQQQTSAESGSSSSSMGPTVKSDVELAPHQFITVAHIETTSRSYEAEDIGRNSPTTSTSSSSAVKATTNNAQQSTRPASISRASAASEDEISRASPTPSEDRQSIASSTTTTSTSTRRRSSLNDSTANASGSTRRNSIASDPAVLDVMIESIKFNIAKSIESKVYDSKGFLLNGKSFEPPKAESSDDKTKEPSGGSSNKKDPEQQQQQQPGPSSLMATNAKKSSSSSSAEDGTTMKTAASATPKLADTAKEIEKLVMGENDKAVTITTSPGTNSTNSADYDSKATTTITAATSSADEQQLAADSAAKTPEKESEPDIVAANKVEEPVNAPVVKAEPEVKKVSPTRRSTRVTALEARRSLSASDSQSLNSSSDDGKSNPKESSPSKSVEATVKSSATPMEIDESTVGKTAAPAEKSTKVATPPPTKTDTDKPIETLNKVADALEQQSVKSDADQKPEPMAVDAEEHDENELRLVIDESKENSVVDESETTAQDCDKMDSATEASNLVDVPKVERTEQKAPTPRVLRTRGDKKKGDKIEKEEKTEPESAAIVNEKVEVNEKVNEEAPAKITENNDTKTESNSNDEPQNVSKSEPPSEQSLNDESIVSVPDSEKVKIEPADLPAGEQKDTLPEVPSKRRMREAKKRFPLKPPAKGKRGPRGRRSERKKSNTPTKEESALDNEVANINKCSNSEVEKSERRGNSAEVADNGTEVSPVNRSKSENDIGTVHRSASSISNGKESRESEESRDSKLMYDLNDSLEEIVEAPAELAKKDFILGLLGLQVSENAENSKIQSDGRNSEEYAKRMAELEKLTPRKNKAKIHRAPIKTIIRVPAKDGETRKRSRSPIKMVLKQQGKQEGDNPDNIMYTIQKENRLISFEGPEKMDTLSDTPPFELNNSHRLSGGCIIEQRPSHSNSVTITPSSYISTNSTVTITPSTSAAGSSSAPMQQNPSVSIHPSNSTVSITPSSTPMSSSTVNITPPTSSITITPSNSIANVTAQLSRMDSSPRVVKLTSGVSIIKKPPPSLQRLQMNNVTATAVNGSAKRKESHPVQKNTGQSGKMMQLTEDDYMRYQTLKKQKISITSAGKSSASGSSHSMLPKKTKSNVSVLEYGKAPPPNQLTFQQQIFRQQEMLNQRHPGDFEPIICDMRASANENSPTQNFLNLNLPKAIHVTKSTAPIATSTPRAHLPTKYPKNLLIIPQPMVQPQDK
ncbi:unnamed protein product [Trichogramma brassicae]|uniref:Uncharacterized protein n=1 Tax=Trichogramma brassicae TaxID=86971 RepID=A0A6H5J8F2_9HYME|nr:unnamed protein product [Trichogramma brassicae]